MSILVAICLCCAIYTKMPFLFHLILILEWRSDQFRSIFYFFGFLSRNQLFLSIKNGWGLSLSLFDNQVRRECFSKRDLRAATERKRSKLIANGWVSCLSRCLAFQVLFSCRSRITRWDMGLTCWGWRFVPQVRLQFGPPSQACTLGGKCLKKRLAMQNLKTVLCHCKLLFKAYRAVGPCILSDTSLVMLKGQVCCQTPA